MAKPDRKPALRDAEVLRQANEARALQAELRTKGLVAVTAQYDTASRRVLVEMSSGLLVGVPVATIAPLAHATDAQLADVEVDELGSGLHWDALDADVGILGLLYGQLGYAAVRRAAAAAGGRASSSAKAAAARANGQKGGRPRKPNPPEKSVAGLGRFIAPSGHSVAAHAMKGSPSGMAVGPKAAGRSTGVARGEKTRATDRTTKRPRR